MTWSNGVFVNVTSYDPKVWDQDLQRADTLQNVGHIELWLEHVPETRKELRDLQGVMNGRKSVVHAPFVGLSLATTIQQLADVTLDRLTVALNCADSIGATTTTVHIGDYFAGSSREAALDRSARFIQLLQNRTNSRIAVENMPRRRSATVDGCSSLDSLLCLQERVPTVHFTLDVGHALQNCDDIDGFVRSHHDSIVNIHLHDATRNGVGHRALGEGELHQGNLARLLKSIAFGGTVGLETIGWDDTVASWAQWLNVLRSTGRVLDQQGPRSTTSASSASVYA